MSWAFSKAMLAGASTWQRVRDVLAKSLPELWQRARFAEKVSALPYGPIIRPAGDTTCVQLIEVTDAADFMLANPTNPREGAEITLEIHNASGGSMGVVTLDSEYRLDSSGFTRPVDGARAVYTFVRTL